MRPKTNPDIMKFRKPGKFLQARFRYLKQQGLYRSVGTVADMLGYEGRGIMYLIFNGEQSINLKDMHLYKKTFKLTELEQYQLSVLTCYHKADNAFEKRHFRKFLKGEKVVVKPVSSLKRNKNAEV